jgi:long-chain acyl-CoA synthetase
MEATPAGALTRAASRDTAGARALADEPSTIPALFWEAAKRHGRRTALRWKQRGIWEAIGWPDYTAAVQEVGCGLLALGLQRGERVAILSETRPEWAFVDLGAQGIGVIPVGIDPAESEERIGAILADCAPRIVFVDNEEQLAKLAAVSARIPALARIVMLGALLHGIDGAETTGFAALRAEGRQFHERHPERWEAELRSARPDDPAVVVYGADGTGPVKGAMLSQRDLLSQMAALSRVAPGKAGDEQLSLLPLALTSERVFSLYRPLALGTIVNMGEGGGVFLDNLREVAPHVALAVPAVWEKLSAEIAAAMEAATLLGQWGYRLALKAGQAVADRRLAKQRVPALLQARVFLARLFVLERARAFIGLRRARLLVSSGAGLSPERVRWFYALGLTVVETDGEGACAGRSAIEPTHRDD